MNPLGLRMSSRPLLLISTKPAPQANRPIQIPARSVASSNVPSPRLRNRLLPREKYCNPDAADEQAYRDQVALVEKHGGREAVLERGGIQGTPAPGDEAEFVS